jgi:hypothetical protein
MRRRRREAAWAFYREHVGGYLLRNGSIGDNPNGAQCVNVANTYWETIGFLSMFGNAGDWVGRRTQSLAWLPARSGISVRAGDVAVFPVGGVHPDGHVALVLDGSRFPWVGLQQNSPTGSPVVLCSYYDRDAAGFLRPL